MNALKRKLLTKWFVEWLDSEKDTELLDMTKLMIERRTLQVRGPIKVIGFRKPKSTITIDFTDAKGMNEIAGVINPIAEGRVKVSVENPKTKRKPKVTKSERLRND